GPGLAHERPELAAARRKTVAACDEPDERSIATRQALRFEQSVVAHVAKRRPAGRADAAEEGAALLAEQSRRQEGRLARLPNEHLDEGRAAQRLLGGRLEQRHLA